MDVQTDWTWETAGVVYLYTQLYVMPLLMMLVFSIIAVFRREMSCNHGYRHSLEAAPSQQPIKATTSKQLATLLTPFLWFGFNRGEHHREWVTDTEEDTTTTTTSTAQRTLDGIMTGLPKQAFEKLSRAFMHRHHRGDRTASPLQPGGFPADVQVNIMSFLHPKDVTTFACTNKTCRDIVDGDGPTPTAVWKTLWKRDYGWIVHSWELGRQAFLRSNTNGYEPHGKDFYFRFGLSYTNYLLAGLNTHDCCYVGLQGNLYDITHFVPRHPGSPETLFVHAGRDATKLFDDMDHSRGARALTKEFCIAVDMSYTESGCGLKPTMDFEADGPIPETVEAAAVIRKKERRLRAPKCLQKIYDDFHTQMYQQQKQFHQQMKDNKKILYWNLYYDPFQCAWKIWYASSDFRTVFQ